MTFRTQTILGPALPMNVSVASKPQLIDQVYGFGIEIVTTGAGSFQIQGSMAEVPLEQAGNITTWSNIGAAIVPTGASTQIVQLDAQYYKWMRVKFDATSGLSSDTFTVKYSAKGP